MEDSRKALMRLLQTYDFCMFDAGLYLDTHPSDQNALDYFEKMRKLRNETAAEYNRLYGPLTSAQSDAKNKWNWTDGPWPWEREV